MATTPTTPKGLSQQEALYRGVAMSQLRILKQQMQFGKLNLASRKVTLDNGVEIYCNICFNKEDVYVFVPPTAVKETTEIVDVVYCGVIFHPRSGALHAMPYTVFASDPLLGVTPETKYLYGIAGGWKNGKTELTTEYIYPLVDEDNASFLVTKPDDAGLAGEFLGETGNYGNLYWWNGDEEEPVLLSWKGTPSRHFRLPNNIDIPGLSIFETSTHGTIEDTPVYTTFGTKLYQGGKVFADAPKWNWPYNPSGVGGRCLILGACQNTNGDIYIVTQSDHYNAPENVFIFSDGHREEGASDLKQAYLTGKPDVTCVFEKALTKPGFFLALWENDGVVSGCKHITELSYSRNGIPWFGNAVGTEFVCSNGDMLTTAGMFTAHTNTAGTWKETAELTGVVTEPNDLWPVGMEFHNTGEMMFDAAYQGLEFFEFKIAELIKANVQLTFAAASTITSSESVYKTFEGSFAIYESAEPAPLTIIGPDTWANTVDYGVNNYSVSGGEGPYEWSWPTGSCGMGIVTVKDCHDKEGVKEVRLPSGWWQQTHFRCNDLAMDVPNYSTSCWVSSGYRYWEEISGNSKTAVYFFVSCVCDPAQNSYSWCQTPIPADTVANYPIPGIHNISCQDSAAPYGGTYYTYNGVQKVYAQMVVYYEWVCP